MCTGLYWYYVCVCGEAAMQRQRQGTQKKAKGEGK